MHVNNEIGVIQDLESIGKLCKENKIVFHVDAAQSPGKVEIDVNKFNIDLCALSAHKAIGSKGITRSDFIISEEANDKVYLLEINTLPGLTRHSLVPKIANNAGFTFDKLISIILKDALR